MEVQLRKREIIRNLTSLFLTKIEKDLQEKPTDVDTLDENLAELTRKEESLHQLNQEIEVTVSGDRLEQEFVDSEKYKEEITLWKTRLERHLRKQGERFGTQSSTASSNSGKTNNTLPNIRLPKLTIERFKGDSACWQSFWSQFSTAIDSNENLGKIDKFNYLKALLEGTAAVSIAGLPLTELNYDTAVKLLHERYGRRDVIVNSHINHLLNLVPVRRSSDFIALRKLYDECQVHVRCLDAMGVASETFGAILSPMLMKALPPDIVLDYDKRKDGEDWNVNELLKFLKKEIESRERTSYLTKSSNDNATTLKRDLGIKWEKPKPWKTATGESHSAAALNAATIKIDTECVYCNAVDHTPENCRIKDVNQKKEILKKQVRCFLCLKKYHRVTQCRNRIRCSLCQRRHHTSLCEGDQETAVKKPLTALSSLAGPDDNQNLYLQTAKAIALGSGSKMLLRCLLDSGSQRSFIKENISRQLELPVLGEEILSIHTFGCDTPIRTKRKRVGVRLFNVNDPKKYVDLEVLEAPKICSALVQIPSKEVRSVMNQHGLTPADFPTSPQSEIPSLTLIIGTDYYWKVVSGNIHRLDDTLVALDTTFGWSIHGPTTVSSTASNSQRPTTMFKIIVEENLTEEELVSTQLKRFWELDALGVTDKCNQENQESNEVLDAFESSITFERGRYKVSLPWKEELKGKLADNYHVAKERLRGLTKRFKREPLLYK